MFWHSSLALSLTSSLTSYPIHPIRSILSGILSGIHSDIFSGILSIYLAFSPAFYIWHSIQAVYLASILTFYSAILSGILSGIYSFWHSIWRVNIALLLVPKQVPDAALTNMSNLMCYCSTDTVACIWHIDFLPSILFGASCRCNMFEWNRMKQHETSNQHSSSPNKFSARLWRWCRNSTDFVPFDEVPQIRGGLRQHHRNLDLALDVQQLTHEVDQLNGPEVRSQEPGKRGDSYRMEDTYQQGATQLPKIGVRGNSMVPLYAHAEKQEIIVSCNLPS